MAHESTLEQAKKAGREKQVRVIETCEKFWDLQEQGKKDKSACNKFVLAVTEELKIPLKGPLANDIFDEVTKGGIWRRCGHGARDARTVGLLARSGQFVLAVTKEKKGHGHVAIVVDWDEVRVRPRAYWGQLNKGGKKDDVLSQSWSAHRLAPGFYTFTYDEFKKNPGIGTPYDHVYFYCTDVP
jgi:hypothetical protein